MQDKDKAQPLFRQFVKKAANDPGQPVTVLRHNLSVLDAESEGYDPYDKPPPLPTEAQIEASLRRRAAKKRPK